MQTNSELIDLIELISHKAVAIKTILELVSVNGNHHLLVEVIEGLIIILDRLIQDAEEAFKLVPTSEPE
ncbi:hypothetical protein RCS94_07940 [Orbaceae bacterium ac157xtp]